MDFVTLTDQFGDPYTYDTSEKVFEIFEDLGCFSNFCTLTNLRDKFFMFIYQGGVSSTFQTSNAKAPFIFDSRQEFCSKLEQLLQQAFLPFTFTSIFACYQSTFKVVPNHKENYEYFLTSVLFFSLEQSTVENIKHYFTRIADFNSSADTGLYFLD